jgi:pSer/pThr/pTyr-binding forkhead associated (FHA) protein
VNRSENVILLQRAGERATVGFRLESGTHVIGRSLGCDIVLPDESVSRRHAELAVAGETITLRDLDSRNGTFVEEIPVQSHELIFGEKIRFGSVKFIIRKLAVNEIEEIDTRPSDPGHDHSTLPSPDLPLSTAQRRVFDLLLAGLSEKQVAKQLEVSRHTVHAHVRQIYRLLSVRSRSELLSKYVRPLDKSIDA